MFELLDELSDVSDLPARRGTTNTSTAGADSISRGVKAGRLVRNPTGEGFISTGSRAGKAFLKKVGGAAKGAAGGVSALLAPLFGALQDPEFQQSLGPELEQTLLQILNLGAKGGETPVRGPIG